MRLTGGEGRFTAVGGCFAQLSFDTQKLIVFGNPVASGGSTGLDLTTVRSDGEIGDREGQGRALSSLGALFYEMGDYEAAAEYIRQGLHIMQEIGDRRMQTGTLTRLGSILVRLEQLTKATETYQQAVDVLRELGQHHLIAEALSGLASVAWIQGDLKQARSFVDEVMTLLDELSQKGISEPLVTYLNCYRVLRAAQDPRDRTILDTAYHLLQEQAAKITDEEMRRSFLENVDVHQEIAREFAKSE